MESALHSDADSALLSEYCNGGTEKGSTGPCMLTDSDTIPAAALEESNETDDATSNAGSVCDITEATGAMSAVWRVCT